MRLARVARAEVALAASGLLALSLGSGGAMALASESGAHPANPHAVTVQPAAAPAKPASVPAGSASVAVQSAVSSTYARDFGGVTGSVSGYVAIDGLGVALDRRGSALQAPASTTKLITTGAALLTMGPASKFTTTVLRTGSDGYSLVIPKPAPVVATYFPAPIVVATAVATPSTSPSATPSAAAGSAFPTPSTGSSSTPSPTSTVATPTPLFPTQASASPGTESPTPTSPTATSPTATSPTGSPSTPSPSPSASTTPTPAQTLAVLPTLAPAPVRVYRAADSSGTLHGDLVLTGAGDPSLTSGDLAALARSVRSSGVKKVTGGVYLDVSKFDSQRGAPGWKKGYVGDESGPLSALMVDGNHRSLSASYRADPDPSNLALFTYDLARAGVKVTGKGRVRRSPHAVTGQVAAHSSAPLTTILRHQDVYSDNTYAEEILKDVGAKAGGSGSSAAGNTVERAIANSLGVSLSKLVDGSGLSTFDRLTAQQEVAWLQAIDTTPVSSAFRSELAVSCGPGTLAGRLCGAYLSGRVNAKTGTLDHTANLAGYTSTKSGRRVWFSLMADKSNVGRARPAIDAVVASLARSNF